jgi:hypothetical protein
MNNLINRNYHETIGSIFKIEMNDDLRLGNALIDRIPYNMIEQIEEDNERKKDNPLLVSDEECRDLIYKVNFNLPQENMKFTEKLFVDTRDYWGLYNFYRCNIYPMNRLDKFTLYSVCRQICKIPITKTEHSQIKTDLKVIKKSMKLLENKKLKKKGGNYKVDF